MACHIGKKVAYTAVLLSFVAFTTGCTGTLSALRGASKVTAPTSNPRAKKTSAAPNAQKRAARSSGAVKKNLTFNGQITGTEVVDIVFNARRGQRLQVNLKASSSLIYFSVLPPGDGELLFVGQSDAEPNEWVGQADVSGNYIIRLYQLGGSKTRDKQATYAVTLQRS